VNSDQSKRITDVRKGTLSFSLNLKYLGQSRLELPGVVSGNLYRFSPMLPVQTVDLRDAKFLLASPLLTVAQ
jgi:hypothetical protein